MKWKLPVSAVAWKQTLNRYKYALVVVAAGLCLLLLPTGGDGGAPAPPAEGESFDLAGFEARLEEVLSRVEGAGDTRVVLTLRSDGLRVLAQDSRRDKDGSITTDVVTVGKGTGAQEVVEIQTYFPQFQGALVVCPGGENPQVRLHLTTALSALTGLGADKISICKGN